MNKKKQLPIWLDKETKLALEEISRKTEYSMARIVNIAIENLLFGRHKDHVSLIRKISNNE